MLHLCCFSGSDGLLKLWQIKTSECMKTLDGHEAKVWTVGGTKEENFFISGGADSTLVLWKVRLLSNFFPLLSFRKIKL